MKILRSVVSLLSVLVLAAILFSMSSQSVLAAQLTRATVRYDRMQANTPSNVYVTFIPVTGATVAKVKLIFGSAVVGAGVSVSVTNLDTGVSTLPGTLVAARTGTSEVDITGVTALSVGQTYGFNINIGISTPASPGSAFDIVKTTTSGDALIDQTTVAVQYLSSDQVVITANVPSTFNFSITGTTDAFTGNLSSGSVVSTIGVGVSVSTNAAKGWTGWIKSANAALSSATTGESIGTTGVVGGSTVTCTSGSDCYILDVGVTAGTGSGSLTAATSYAGNGTTSGGAFSTSLQPFVFRTGKTNNDTVWLKAHVAMIATKAAGSDYTDTWTIVGAGNF